MQIHIGPPSLERPEELHSVEIPRFARELVPTIDAAEGQPVHLECRLLPSSDPKMTVEW